MTNPRDQQLPQAARVQRRAGRVLLLDPTARVLLLRGGDPSRPEAGHWWFTVGGGCDADESTADATRREAREEAGVELPANLGPIVLQRVARFEFEGVAYEQAEDYYLVLADSDAVSTAGWTPIERRSVTGYRWWSIPELRAISDLVYPEGLADVLASLLDE